MASSFTTDLGIEQQTDGENSGTWGQKQNNNHVLLEEAVAGVVDIDLVSGNVTLAITDGTSSNGRHAVLEASGAITSNARVITIPASKTKWYIIRNLTTATTGSVAITVSGGSNSVDIPKNETRIVYSDGSEVYQLSDDQALIGKQTSWWPAVAFSGVVTNGATLTQVEVSAGTPEVIGYAFSPSTSESVQFKVRWPKSWDEGTLTAVYNWTANDTTTNGVAWKMEAVALGDNDAFSTSYGTAITTVDNNQSAANRNLNSAESSALTVGNTPAEGDVVYVRITRDTDNGSDNLAVDAILVGATILWTTNAGNDA